MAVIEFQDACKGSGGLGAPPPRLRSGQALSPGVGEGWEQACVPSPGESDFLFHTFPRLKRWAIIFRAEVLGLRPFVSQVEFHNVGGRAAMGAATPLLLTRQPQTPFGELRGGSPLGLLRHSEVRAKN
jgi:hypothetical protein